MPESPAQPDAPSPLRRRWTVGRVVCLVVGLALLVVCGREIWFSLDWDRRLALWETEVPVRLVVDPASACEASAVFHHTCSVAHGQQVLLRVVHADGSPAPTDTWPRRIEAEMVLDAMADGGSRFVECMGCSELSPAMVPEHGMLLATALVGPPGEYRFRFVLTAPVAAPTDVRYEITMRNLLCGLERLPGAIAFIIGIAAGVLGLLFAAPAAIKIIRSHSGPPPGGPATP